MMINIAKDPEDDFLDDENIPNDDENLLEVDDLSFDEEKGSYELDVDDDDPDWDHPADYATISEGAEEDSSGYDNSNPLVGNEYAELDELKEQNLNRSNMHITSEESLKVSTRDEELSQTEEDFRDDLDEEGYRKE
ncbi:hypothetical protein GCM10011418_32440 [Sphingobacterium alkalisoli]|uniref:hypothetical protein n=1 Tax=Sphingobacterium alkalisoli TaxID=1874115 RepID=UPI0019B2C93D|nr:hypothetical protein [Sphingobacterium alkalisoli]GGH24489.1 hypothetical protein GCM10011418_32440 [Sphingobacterium alkalisoli]